MNPILTDVAGLDVANVRAKGLAHFVRLAWPVVEAGPLKWNWHIDIICDALERVSNGECRKLVICVPPGSMKTLLTGVFWPAWDWIDHPERRVIHTTYGGNLALKAARAMRHLIKSEWYRERWPDVTIPYQKSQAVTWFENSIGGSRFSGSVGGEVTGRHAHILVGDDLNKAIDALGASLRGFDDSWAFWKEILPTRQAEPKTTARVLIGQRLHRDDVPGRWMREDPEVEVICLPMRYVPNHPNATPSDPRTEEGEPLWPERFGEKELAELEGQAGMGPAAVASQLQQDPIPPGGQLLREEYLSRRYPHLPSSLQRAIQTGRAGPGQTWRIYGDMTFKGKATSDWVVLQLWVTYENQHYLVDQIRGQWGFLASKQSIHEFAARYMVAQSIHLEDAANAPALVEELRADCPVPVLLAPVDGGCLARTQAVEGVWASGAVLLPASAPWLGGSDGFIAEHLAFDGLGTRHDDQVATSSLALVDLSGAGRSQWAANWSMVAA